MFENCIHYTRKLKVKSILIALLLILLTERALVHTYSLKVPCACGFCLEESYKTVDDLQEAVDAVSSSLRRPVFGSATKLYQTAMSYIEKKDGIEGSQEFSDAIEDNIRFGAYLDDLAAVIAAIRYAENGKTYQYGIIHKSCPKTYKGQAGWCAATVQKNWDRWLKGGKCNNSKCTVKHKPGDSRDINSYISYLGHVYAPADVKNDPDKLNKHWVKNVLSHYNRILTLSK